ncbi:hypothetical protein SFOMI_4981 [Sphingobium fuliginis]|uniref:Uncharacterized protein n=1 Tax=Sphingobium fuliginis (strain ATCC 27551) TaxID=336203 RepID=A0A292ZNE1_SPHSA|nr:hypothetical protein SFOMI_4981 [Sphingobium fuliginis]
MSPAHAPPRPRDDRDPPVQPNHPASSRLSIYMQHAEGRRRHIRVQNIAYPLYGGVPSAERWQ